MKMNFKEVPDVVTSEFPLIPEGVPVSLAIKEVVITDSNSGGKNLVIDFQDMETKANAREYLSFQSANGEPLMFVISRIKKLLVACNVLPEGEISIELVPNLLAGGTFIAEFTHREHNGKTYSNINWDKDLISMNQVPNEVVSVNESVSEAVVQAVNSEVEVDI